MTRWSDRQRASPCEGDRKRYAFRRFDGSRTRAVSRPLGVAGTQECRTQSGRNALGALLCAFFVDHLTALKGLRPASVQSYRDTLRLFLRFVATDRGCRLTRLTVADLSFERVTNNGHLLTAAVFAMREATLETLVGTAAA